MKRNELLIEKISKLDEKQKIFYSSFIDYLCQEDQALPEPISSCHQKEN